MKLNSEEKAKLVARYYNGEPVSNICTQTGIARSTFYSWLQPYQTITTKSGVSSTPLSL